MKYRPEIDGLRAVAVMSVVLYHANVLNIRAGYIGVDVFFVISGFLISRIIFAEFAAGQFSFIKFYARRFRRIIPALMIMVSVTLAGGWYILAPPDYLRLAQSAAAASAFAANVFFWKEQGYFAPATAEQPLIHTWSLGIEEQFYILFPVLVWAVNRFAQNKLFPIMTALTCGSFILAAVGVFIKPSATFYLLPTRAWELFTGSLLALSTQTKSHSPRLNNVLSCMGLALIVAPLWVYPKLVLFPGAAALPPVLGTALLIHLGQFGFGARLLSTFAMRFIGRISYSFYLWHFPLLAAVAYVSINLPSTSYQLAAVSGAFLLAVVSTMALEEPIRHCPFITSEKNVVVCGVVVCVLIGAIGMSLSTTFVNAAIYGQSTEDHKVTFVIPCMSEHGTRYDDPQCLIGTPAGKPAFAIWGDSHAEIASAIFNQSARDARVNGLLIGGWSCSPFGPLLREFNDECPTINERGLKFLRNASSVRTVVLAAHWARYIEGNSLHDSVWANNKPSVGNDAAIVGSLKQAIVHLESQGFKVWIIGPTPESIVDGTRFAYMRKRGFLSDTNAYALPEAVYRMNRATAILSQATHATNARLVRPATRFCKDELCSLELDGKPLLRDDHHLSRRGAQLLKPFADQVVRELLKNNLDQSNYGQFALVKE